MDLHLEAQVQVGGNVCFGVWGAAWGQIDYARFGSGVCQEVEICREPMTHNRRKWDWLDHLTKLILAIATLIVAWKTHQQGERLDEHKMEIQKNSQAIHAVGEVQSAVLGVPNVAGNDH